VYLFQRRQMAERPDPDAEPPDLETAPTTTPLHDVLPTLNTSAIQPGSAAEWAIGELLIRLCNRGRALRPEAPEEPRP
jgi:hypothetical protein